MNIITLTALSFSMSMDAFAVAISRGVSLQKPSFVQALKIGLVFGFVEALTPLLGYFLGVLTKDFVENFDHWLAFVLLSALGLHLIYEALAGKDDEQKTSNNTWVLILTAFATSIDAMVIGMSLAFLSVNIWLACFLIGLATTIMATTGVYLGNKLGEKIGQRAEIMGGVVLIGIGSFILLTHLGVLS